MVGKTSFEMLTGLSWKVGIRRKWRICIQQFKNGKCDDKSPKGWRKFKLDSKEMSLLRTFLDIWSPNGGGGWSSHSIRKLPSASAPGEFVEFLGWREISMFPLLFMKYGPLRISCEIVWDFDDELPWNRYVSSSLQKKYFMIMHIMHPILNEMRNSPRRWNEVLWNKYFH